MRLPVSADSHRYRTQFRLASILLFAAACVLLYFGTGMLLFVPGYPGEAYFVTKRVLYGLLPSICTLALLVAVGWLWGHSSNSENYWNYVKRSFLCAMAAVSLFWLGLMIIAGFRQG